jgi:hypothetical protein
VVNKFYQHKAIRLRTHLNNRIARRIPVIPRRPSARNRILAAPDRDKIVPESAEIVPHTLPFLP